MTTRTPHCESIGARSPLGPCLAALWLAACASEEAPRVHLPVAVDASRASTPVTSDLGYTVVLTAARAAIEDLQFTTGGETHVALLDRLHRWLVPAALAHPGHGSGGEVLGELPGRFVVDWLSNAAALGTAQLLVSHYRGANFGFRRATAGELPASDPLTNHTFHLEGTASKEGRSVAFTAVLDVDETAALIGAPFDLQVTAASNAVLGLRLLPLDPTDPTDTLWNQVDFFALPGATSGTVSIAAPQEAHNLLVRALRTHDHYDVTHHGGGQR